MLRPGRDITLVSYGVLINQVLDAAEGLAQRGIQAEVVKLGRIAPLDLAPVAESVGRTGRLLVAEEAMAAGGVGERLAAALLTAGVPVKGLALANLGAGYLPHGSVEQLLALRGLDGAHLIKRVEEVLRHGEKAAGCAADRAGIF